MDQDIIPYCIRNEKSVIAYSPLERGLLTGKMQPDTDLLKAIIGKKTLFYRRKH